MWPMREALAFAAAYARARGLLPGGRFRAPEALAAHQERLAVRHLAWVRARSPATEARFGGRPTATWRTLAPTTKADMMRDFDRLVTAPGVTREAAFAVALQAEASRDFAPLLPGGIAVGLSSGTSGHRGLFLASPEERAAWAGTILGRMLPGGLGGTMRPGGEHRVAFFLRASSALYQRLGSQRLRFAFFDLLDAPVSHIARLNTFQPTVLTAPPAMLRLLADAQRHGRLGIAPVRVISVADVLADEVRDEVEAAFNHRVHQVYQATEGLLGATCALGTLHLCEADVIVEREYIGADVGGAQRFVPVVTDLRRRTQPIVRHRLDDVLVLRSAPCACGDASTALERVEGRADDVFVAVTGNGRQVAIFPDFLRRAVLIGAPAARAYALRQTATDRVEVALDVDEAARPASEAGVRAEIDALWDRRSAAAPSVVFTGPPAGTAPGAKERRVARTFEADLNALG